MLRRFGRTLARTFHCYCFKLVIKKIRDKLRETILFVFLSYLFWGLLIFILLAIGSNWSFIKISLSILLTISLIEFFPIWLSCKTAKFLPGLRNKISKIEQEKQFEEEKEKLS